MGHPKEITRKLQVITEILDKEKQRRMQQKKTMNKLRITKKQAMKLKQADKAKKWPM